MKKKRIQTYLRRCELERLDRLQGLVASLFEYIGNDNFHVCK
jgi:hypothetical protein